MRNAATGLHPSIDTARLFVRGRAIAIFNCHSIQNCHFLEGRGVAEISFAILGNCFPTVVTCPKIQAQGIDTYPPSQWSIVPLRSLVMYADVLAPASGVRKRVGGQKGMGRPNG